MKLEHVDQIARAVIALRNALQNAGLKSDGMSIALGSEDLTRLIKLPNGANFGSTELRRGGSCQVAIAGVLFVANAVASRKFEEHYPSSLTSTNRNSEGRA